MKIKPIILGIKGTYLSKKEYFLFKQYSPIGYIIFSRNIQNFLQLKNLISQLKSINPKNDILIMIDHEGGRVNRFLKFFNQDQYSAQIFGKLYKTNLKQFNYQLDNFINVNSNLFNFLGINLVAAPVMDLFYPNASLVIGDRAYSNKVDEVKTIGKIVIEKYKKRGILTIAKHAPGHGLSKLDSHYYLPKITHNRDFLFKNDFSSFKNIKSPLLITAHIVYDSLDKTNPATFSKFIIKGIIKKILNYKGLIMSDDICMKALKGTVEVKARKSFQAGCDIVLHCSGNFNEMQRLLLSSPDATSLLLTKIIKIFNYRQ